MRNRVALTAFLSLLPSRADSAELLRRAEKNAPSHKSAHGIIDKQQGACRMKTALYWVAALVLYMAATGAHAQVVWFPHIPGAPPGWWLSHMGTDAKSTFGAYARDCNFVGAATMPKSAWKDQYNACNPVTVQDDQLSYLFDHDDVAQDGSLDGKGVMIARAKQLVDLHPAFLQVKSMVSTEHQGSTGGGSGRAVAWGKLYFRVPDGKWVSAVFNGTLNHHGRAGSYNGSIQLSVVPNTIKTPTADRPSFALGGSITLGTLSREYLLSPGVYRVTWNVNLQQHTDAGSEAIIDATFRETCATEKGRELPARIPLDKDGKQTTLTGVFGPYRSMLDVERALTNAEPALWEATEDTGKEFGLLVVWSKASQAFYLTPPIEGQSTIPYTEFELPESLEWFGHDVVSYDGSVALATDPSACLPAPADFNTDDMAATVHTHPHDSMFSQNQFSTNDFKGAIEQKGRSGASFRGAYLFPPDHCIRYYKPSTAHKCSAIPSPNECDVLKAHVRRFGDCSAAAN